MTARSWRSGKSAECAMVEWLRVGSRRCAASSLKTKYLARIALPRSFDRGLIEATGAIEPEAESYSNFRDPLIAASLKPLFVLLF